MAKYCKSCGEEIHPLRVKALPNTQTCIKCSTTSMKKGIPVLNGNIEKDDTWVDVVFIDENE
jgi:RNA polymerase-binding transcription factor DksA